MTAEWLTAIGTIGTFVVIAASAGAALLQLRHTRSGNAISLLTAYNNEFDTQDFQLAFAYVRSELPERLKDDAVLDEPAKAPPFVGEYAFVLTNLLDSDIVCTLYSENVTSAWRSISPVAGLLRYKLSSPSIWENFEYLARISTDFIEQHGEGTYPPRVLRMPIDPVIVERWKAREAVCRVG